MKNKHPLRLILVLLLVFACFCSSAFAEEQAGLGLEMKTDEADYAVTVQLRGTSGLEMLQFCLRYDDEKLALQSVVPGEVFMKQTVPTISATEPGRVYLVWDALSPLENGALLELRFTAKDFSSRMRLVFPGVLSCTNKMCICSAPPFANGSRLRIKAVRDASRLARPREITESSPECRTFRPGFL